MEKSKKKRKGRCERTEREEERGGHERVEPKPITILCIKTARDVWLGVYNDTLYTLSPSQWGFFHIQAQINTSLVHLPLPPPPSLFYLPYTISFSSSIHSPPLSNSLQQ